MIDLWVIGSGSHAKVVIDAAQQSGQYRVVGCLDDDAERHGNDVMGVPIVGDTSGASIESLAVTHAVISIGDNVVRRRIAERMPASVIWETVVHPTAVVAESVDLGAGTVVMAGAILQPGAMVGKHAILNTMSSVDHDCFLGDFTHVGPGVHLAGNVELKEGAMLGVGVSIIPGIRIGQWTTVGAGAAVVRDLPAHVAAVGVPARVLRRSQAT